MLDAVIYEQNVLRGLADPLPWWLPFLDSAKRTNSQPWLICFETTGVEVPIWYWHMATMIVSGAELDVQIAQSKSRKA